jgi:hypothetical protein
MGRLTLLRGGIMADDKSKTSRADRDRVNVHEKHELDYWTMKWGITPAQPKEAAKTVGPMVKDVARHLGQKN